jgi:hypothetical protein
LATGVKFIDRPIIYAQAPEFELALEMIAARKLPGLSKAIAGGQFVQAL